MDTHIDKQVAIQLRTHGVDVIRCEEVGMPEAEDNKHLAYATEHNRAIITKDDDFVRLHMSWQKIDRNHSGIFFCIYRDRPAIGLIVRECLTYYQAIESGAGTIDADIRNRLYYIT
jgi:hypothetical protein